MMHHHHPMQQNQIQRGDPNRRGQQAHCIIPNQQRGHPIMLGVPGASAVPPPGVIVTMPSVPIQAIPQQPQTTVPVHQQSAPSVPQQSTPPQVLHSQQHEPIVEQQPDKVQNSPGGGGQQPQPPMGSENSVSSNISMPPGNGTIPSQQGSGASVTGDSNNTTGTGSAPLTPNSCLANTKEKTPMCLINELARYNKIQHQYRLEGESGPAHQKSFKVSLKLDSEQYEATDLSIKKAQHAAAKEALLKTKLKHPPVKTRCNFPMGNGVNGFNGRQYHPFHRANANVYGQQPANRFNYDSRRYNPRGGFHGHFENQGGRYPNYNGYNKRTNGPGWNTGVQQVTPPANPTPTVTNTEELGFELKSPISLVYEIALKRNLHVNFEVESEKGLPHMKVFKTKCQVGDMMTDGEGNGKKISKKRAAEKMLDKLKTLPPVSPAPFVRFKRKSTIPKKKTRSLIKALLGENQPDYTEEINPISRLMQIQQAKKEKEPIYNLLEERAVARRREFVMEVTVGVNSATGTGPNKKLAKRAAAEALLQILESYPTHPQPETKTTVETTSTTTTSSTTTSPTTTTSTQGGTSGRQLVPGLLLMCDQTISTFTTPKTDVNIQTTATIAKELLKAGNSPTADALAHKSGHKINDQNKTQTVRPKQQLLYLSKLLGFQVQFSDFPKANHEEFLTLLCINTEPPQVCHGFGDSTDTSHDAAAYAALRCLSDLGLDNNIQLDNNVQLENSKKESQSNGIEA